MGKGFYINKQKVNYVTVCKLKRLRKNRKTHETPMAEILPPKGMTLTKRNSYGY